MATCRIHKRKYIDQKWKLAQEKWLTRASVFEVLKTFKSKLPNA